MLTLFIGFSSPKEQDSEDSVKPENNSPNRDWIPPEDQNQPKNSVSFDWLEFTVTRTSFMAFHFMLDLLSRVNDKIY